MFAVAAAARPESRIATANPDLERGGCPAVGRRVSALYTLHGCAGGTESGIDLIGSRCGVSTSQIDLPQFPPGNRIRMSFPAIASTSRPSDIAPDALSVLNSVFGLPGFRGAQEEIVGHVVAGGNCLVLMPTGGGKSLCYQLPSLLREGCGIVVSPLIALIG